MKSRLGRRLALSILARPPICIGLAATVCGFALMCGTSLRAEQPYQAFLQGLRARGYYDTALDYLEQLESRPDVTDEMRLNLEFEKALTLMQSAETTADPELSSSQRDKALELLVRFAESHRGHPLAARAESERGRILLARARALLQDAELSSNKTNLPETQERAREQIRAAHAIFQTAHDAHKATWEGFDAYIPPDQAAKVAARDDASRNYVRAQMDLAVCTFEEASTYPRGTKERNDLLDKANEQLASIYEKFRGQFAGKQARMWQGRCFQEQDEIGKALGIYDELLREQGASVDMINLKNRVQLYRLMCLAHEKRKDYNHAVLEAKVWLEGDKQRAREPIGLAIRRELALTLEKMASASDVDKEQKERYLKQALDEAREIHKSPGIYKNESQAMVARMEIALGREPGDPKDFESAYNAARTLVDEIADRKQEVDDAQSAEDRTRLGEDFDRHLRETERLLKVAIDLSKSQNDLSMVNRARYFLAYVYYLKRWSYDAAVLAEFVGHSAKHSDPDAAVDATLLAMAAFLQLYDAAKEDDRAFEQEQIVRLGTLILKNWPESPRANEARVTLADFYRKNGNPVEAARILSAVPETAEQYPAAQIEAGHSHWSAYLDSSSLPAEKKPSAQELKSWKTSAKKELENGIRKLKERDAIDASTIERFITAKAALAHILITEANYDEATQMLVEDPEPVMQAIVVGEGEQRPAKGIRSSAFAAWCYQLQLRGYVGAQQIDKALEAMQKLEAVAGADASESGQIYRQLGQQIEKEIERLAAENNVEQLGRVRDSFEHFLAELYARKQQMPFSSLVWIGEAYTGLAEGMAESDSAAARDYFAKAAEIYQESLGREDLPPGRDVLINLRLAASRRGQGEFESAAQIIERVIAQKPLSLDAQLEAAALYEQWGSTEGGKNSQQLLLAINGNGSGGKGGSVWGWAKIASQLVQSLNTTKLSPEKRAEYRDRYFNARYHVSLCRREFGLSHADKAKKQQNLEAARRELEGFALLTDDIDAGWKERFNKLYGDLLADKKIARAQLQWATTRTSPEKQTAKTAPTAKPNTTDTKKNTTAAKTNAPAPERQSGSGSVFFALLLALAVAAGLVLMIYRKSRRPRRRNYAAPAPVQARTRPPAAGGQVASTAKPAQARTRVARAPNPHAGQAPSPPAGPVRVKRPPKPGE